MEEKSAISKVVFTRKSVDLAGLRTGTWSEGISARVVVERVVELPPASYVHFAGNLLAASSLLREHQNEMYVDTDDVWHCLLVKEAGARDGILVNAEGSSYARYSAYCPDCRPFMRDLAERANKPQEEGGGGTLLPHEESRKPDRFFLVAYDYVESEETRRCGFFCEAKSIREAAERFWNQHPSESFPETFLLRSVTDGTTLAYWIKESGQFVTVPEREDDQASATSREEMDLRQVLPVLRSLLQSGHRQQDRQHRLVAEQSERRKGKNTKGKQQGR